MSAAPQLALRSSSVNREDFATGRGATATLSTHDFSRVPVYANALGQLQTKLTAGLPGDQYEREADRVADRVMRTPTSHTCECGGACPSCSARQQGLSNGKLQVQRVQADGGVSTGVRPLVHEVLASPGRPLDPVLRAFMEPRFGHDFGHVRVHTDAKAAESALTVNALAYTVGRDVVFGAGQYAPQTSEGRRLVAHELIHTIQQSSGPSDRWAGGQTRPQYSGSKTGSVRLQRQPATPEELAGGALKTGPKDKTERTAFEKAAKGAAEAEKKGASTGRVTIAHEGKDDGVKGVSSSEFEKAFKKCPTARGEDGVPKAFLCTTDEIAPPSVATDDHATIDTNVRVNFKPGNSGGGSIWVVTAALPWALNTAGFLDIDVIDSKMLTPYRNHEKGHSTIAHQIRDRLATMLQSELEGALPGEKNPLQRSGKNWVQAGVEAIVNQISGIRTRYMKWFDELDAAADSQWDTQEKAALNSIAAAIKAKQNKPGSSVPDAP